VRSVFVALVAVVTVLGGVDALAEAAPLRGQVVFVGPPPAPRRIPVTVDQYVCGKDKEAEDLVLSPRQGVRSAVVWLTEPPPTARPVEAPAPPQMDQ
jgi:hypothetical protein